MNFFFSSLLFILRFPHDGRIVTVDQLAYSPKNPNASSDSIVLLVNDSQQRIENFGVGMYS